LAPRLNKSKSRFNGAGGFRGLRCFYKSSKNVAGDIIHYKGLFIHRDERDENNRTLPAVVYKNGTKEWWLDGLICRRDMDSEGRWMPVRVDESGRPEWWKLNPRTLPKSEPIWFPQEIFSIDSRYPGE